MITFQLEKPFLQKDIDEAIKLEKENIKVSSKQTIKYGINTIIAEILFFSVIGIEFIPKTKNDICKLIFAMFWLFIGIVFLVIPIFLKNSGSYSIYLTSYLNASSTKLHNCEAFILMPGMEKYKEYVDNVKKQGRELTNFECDEIINYWNSLIKK
jgi:hypothetical protein